MTGKMRKPKVTVKPVALKKWRPYAIYGLLLIAVAWLVGSRLGSLTHGYASDELSTFQASVSLHNIYLNPLNAPLFLLVHVLLYIRPHSLYMVRVAAALLGVLTIAIFYRLVDYWHGRRSALFGTVIFATSAWFLHTARLGTPNVLYFGLLGLIGCSVWFKHSRRSLPVVLLIILSAILLYVPGMIWFIIAGVIWQWKTIDRVFQKHLWMVTLGGFLLLGVLTPLGLAIRRTPSLAKVMIGLPQNGWPNPLSVFHRIVDVPVRFFLSGPFSPERWLGHLPILDALSAAMVFLGVYVYLKHLPLVRAQLLGVILVIGTVIIGLGGQTSITVLVPIVYILAAAGIGLLLDRWYTVFPRNPIAQAIGIGMASLAVLTSVWYGYQHYFVAWPNSPETKPIFDVTALPPSDTIKR